MDWSWETHAVCVVDGDGQVVRRFPVAHSAAGLSQLVGQLRFLGVDGVAIERGDGPVVQALLNAGLPVFDSRQASPWAADIYDRARARGARHPHAVRILARGWIRVLWRCWTDHTAYDPAQHRGLLRLQEQAVA